MEKRVIPFSPPDISELEIAEVVEALRSGWITTGQRTKLLERRLAAYIKTGKNDSLEAAFDKCCPNVVCLSSGTAAEELNLRLLGVREGDEVLVTSYTYTSTASAAVHCGATVRFVDIQQDGDPDTHMPEMDYEKLEAAITPRTKAVIAVDLGGVVADYDRMFAAVERKKDLFCPLEPDGTLLGNLSSRIQKALGRVAVMADSAHSLGASRLVWRAGGETFAVPTQKRCGAIADFTSFSFHAVKNFTTGEGGASTWLPLDGVEDAEIYRIFQLLSLHGQSRDALEKSMGGSWEYDIVGPWYKANMTDITAAIGLRQLDRYPELLKKRRQMLEIYDAACKNLGLSCMIHQTEKVESASHLYLVRVPGICEEKRNRIIEEMARRGVSANVHFKPLPMMTAYGKDVTEFPNAYDYYRNLITLPFHTRMTKEDQAYVCEVLAEAIRCTED